MKEIFIFCKGFPEVNIGIKTSKDKARILNE